VLEWLAPYLLCPRRLPGRGPDRYEACLPASELRSAKRGQRRCGPSFELDAAADPCRNRKAFRDCGHSALAHASLHGTVRDHRDFVRLRSSLISVGSGGRRWSGGLNASSFRSCFRGGSWECSPGVSSGESSRRLGLLRWGLTVSLLIADTGASCQDPFGAIGSSRRDRNFDSRASVLLRHPSEQRGAASARARERPLLRGCAVAPLAPALPTASP
jgi:hypothetical protein